MKRFGTMALAAVAVLLSSSLAQAGSLTTLFSGGNNHNGNMFDIIAYNDLTVTGWDINFTNLGSGSTAPVEVYYRLGGYSGHQDTPGDWTFLGSTNATSNGPGTASPLNLGGLNLLAGNTYGIYITATDTFLNYSNGTAGSEGTVYSSNSDLAITVGLGKAYAFGSNFSPRIWNGTVFYETSNGNGNGDPNAVPTPAALGSGMMLLGAMLLKRRRQAA